MELLVFGHAGARVIVFPTREGRFFDYEDWGLVEALRPSVDSGHIQLFCVDSLDSETFYCRHCHPEARIARHNAYEGYILDEVLPFTRLVNPNPVVVAHGCSIGAFHAVNIALRHPHVFRKVVGLSGRYDLTQPVGDFADLFHGYYSQDVYFHMPNHYVPNLADDQLLGRLREMEIVLAVGETDPFRPSTEGLSNGLRGKGAHHVLAIWEGEAHRARYWRKMVPYYL